MLAPTTSALWITGPRQSEIRHAPLADCNDETLLIKTLHSGISRGTESLIYNNEVPASEFDRMRAPFQEGDFPFPVKYGYSNVGCVQSGPTEWLGKTVFCLFPHQTHYCVPASALTLVPECVPAKRAILAANMETAVNALWDSNPSVGDKITVVGAGVVGSLIGWLAAKIPGTHVELVDINDERATLAHSFGLHFKRPENASTQRDLVIHASASEAGLQTALACAGFEATIVEVSWYGTKHVSIPLGGIFHSQRLTLKSSQVGQIANSQRSRWNYKRRMTLAISLLDNECLDRLVSGENHFSELPDTLSKVTLADSNTLCHCINYA